MEQDACARDRKGSVAERNSERAAVSTLGVLIMGKIILMGLVAAGVVLGAGCSKKEESATEAAATPPETPAADATATAAPAAPAAPAGGETLPGASRVREALASKDY